MKKIIIPLLFVCINSCHAQKIGKKISDTKKLENNKTQFIGKEFKELLYQISPKIKTALGNPEQASNTRLSSISLYFVDKNQFLSRKKSGQNPIRVIVTLKKGKAASYPKLDPNEQWSEKLLNIYGDMIIVDIAVLGEN